MGLNIGILGGGIAGLSSAYYLARDGHRVTVFEASAHLGGLGTFFEFNDRYVDRFYHCIMPSDESFLRLIDDLGATDRLYWRDTTMGMVYENSHYPFNSAPDLLRFSPLTIPERLRMGFMGLLLPYLGNDEKLDQLPIEDWLKPLFGPALWRKFWQPLFAAKFGDGAGTLPSLYLSKRLGRESNAAKRGYIRGGLHRLIEDVTQGIGDLNGRIVTDAPVDALALSEHGVTIKSKVGTDDFDLALSTLPISTLKKLLADDPVAHSLPDLRYQGVVNLLLLLDRPLTGHYWTPILHSGTPFDGAVESSALIEPEQYGGYHAVYLMKYTPRNSNLFETPSDAIAAEWSEHFLRVFADTGITRKNIRHQFVFKAPFVEPIYPLNYTQLRPKTRLGATPLFLATTAHVYPNITSWNSSITVARKAVREIAAVTATPTFPESPGSAAA